MSKRETLAVCIAKSTHIHTCVGNHYPDGHIHYCERCGQYWTELEVKGE